jgi:hypothetical protein
MSSYTRIVPDYVFDLYDEGVPLYTKKNSEEFVKLENREQVTKYCYRAYSKDGEDNTESRVLRLEKSLIDLTETVSILENNVEVLEEELNDLKYQTSKEK